MSTDKAIALARAQREGNWPQPDLLLRGMLGAASILRSAADRIDRYAATRWQEQIPGLSQPGVWLIHRSGGPIQVEHDVIEKELQEVVKNRRLPIATKLVPIDARDEPDVFKVLEIIASTPKLVFMRDGKATGSTWLSPTRGSVDKWFDQLAKMGVFGPLMATGTRTP